MSETTKLEDSILKTLKKMLGLEDAYKAFDLDIILIANSAFMALSQAGVGPQGFVLNNAEQTWSSFLGSRQDLSATQTFVFAKVKIAFDPPPTSYALESLGKIADESLWRLMIQAETEGADYDSR